MIFTLLQTDFLTAVAYILAIVLSIGVHEFAHALASFRLGDMTAKHLGRLTLNPLAHLDFMGTLMLLFAGFGWGKPVPYNPYNLKYPKWGGAMVALAGPVSNLFFIILSVAVLKSISSYLPPENYVFVFLQLLIFVNLMLGVFNLIPIPPLDGSKVLFTLLPARYDELKMRLSRNGPFVLLAVIILDNLLNLGIFARIFYFFINLLSRVVF